MTAPIAQPGIMNIQPYVPGLSEVDGMAEVVKISSNESAIGPSRKAIDAYLKIATELHRYPDGGSNRLRHGLDGSGERSEYWPTPTRPNPSERARGVRSARAP